MSDFIITQFIVAAAVCFCLIARANAHGSLTVPRSRNAIFFNNNWSSTAGNGLGPRGCGGFCRPVGSPGVCGDPYQEVEPRTNVAGMTNYPIQATYVSGQVVRFSILMQVNHGGRFTFRLCDRRTNLDQACFNARTLLRSDNGRPNWYVLTGRYADPPTTLSMEYRLPAGFSCPSGCVIQWEYFTYNTCLERCDRAECGFYADRMNYIIPSDQGPKPICYSSASSPPPEIFRNCADVIITGGNPGTPPPVSPPPASPPPGTFPPGCAKCNLPAPAGCKCDNNCNCLPTPPPGGGPCDKCNRAPRDGGCKCNSNCDCLPGTGGSVCDKCNIAVTAGGCKCNSNCQCLAARAMATMTRRSRARKSRNSTTSSAAAPAPEVVAASDVVMVPAPVPEVERSTDAVQVAAAATVPTEASAVTAGHDIVQVAVDIDANSSVPNAAAAAVETDGAGSAPTSSEVVSP